MFYIDYMSCFILTICHVYAILSIPNVPFQQPACGAQCRRLSFPAASLPRPRFDRKVAYKALIRSHFLVKGEPRKNFSLSFPARQGTGGGDANSPCCLPQTCQSPPC